MKTNLLKIIICLLCMVPSLLLYAVKHEPYSGSRIYWDISSKKLLFPSGNYARVIQLQDAEITEIYGHHLNASYRVRQIFLMPYLMLFSLLTVI